MVLIRGPDLFLDRQGYSVEAICDPAGRCCAAGSFHQKSSIIQHKVSFSGLGPGHTDRIAILKGVSNKGMVIVAIGSQDQFLNSIPIQIRFSISQAIILAEGRKAASIRRIAKEMGCSSASLYRYFENQSELIYYAELNQLSGYIKRLNAAEKSLENIWDRYAGIWGCYCRDAFRNPDVYDLLFLKSENTKLNATVTEY